MEKGRWIVWEIAWVRNSSVTKYMESEQAGMEKTMAKFWHYCSFQESLYQQCLSLVPHTVHSKTSIWGWPAHHSFWGLLQQICIQSGLDTAVDCGDVSFPHINCPTSKPDFWKCIIIYRPWAHWQTHEFSSAPGINGVGNSLLDNITISLSCLCPTCPQLYTHHVQVVR